LLGKKGVNDGQVSILYPNQSGTKFNMSYYVGHHMPMVRRLLGSALKGMLVEQGICGERPGSPAPYIATGYLLFESLEVYETSFAPHAEEIIADIPKYTNSEPLIQIGEVKL
jgi:uncharacterized protein (TIGR02118 family)